MNVQLVTIKDKLILCQEPFIDGVSNDVWYLAWNNVSRETIIMLRNRVRYNIFDDIDETEKR